MLIIIFGLGILIAVIASKSSSTNLFRRMMDPWFLGPPSIGLIILLVGMNEGGSTLTLAYIIFPISVLLGFLFTGVDGGASGNGGGSCSGGSCSGGSSCGGGSCGCGGGE
ncbi:MAG: hypothetical protein ACJ0K4_13440 [Verrucomicrobiales bacterium]